MIKKKTAPRKFKSRRRQLASFFGSRGDHASSSPEKQESGSRPVAAHMFSGRLLIMLGVLAVIVVAAYSPISTFLNQQAEINQVKSNISSLEEQNQNLETQLEWWKDDNYVKQQAKSRLFYITEGETPYIVTGTDYTSNLADDTSAAAQTAPEASWTNNLWNSFQESALDGEENQTSQKTAEEAATATATATATGSVTGQ